MSTNGTELEHELAMVKRRYCTHGCGRALSLAERCLDELYREAISARSSRSSSTVALGLAIERRVRRYVEQAGPDGAVTL